MGHNKNTMIRRLWHAFRTADFFLDKHALSLGLALLVVILRIPTLAEPYWYGDEAIYLTIGNSLGAGERLYLDIVDHKTPIIYYLAALAHTQFGFRILAMLAVALSTVAFFVLIRDLFHKPLAQVVAMSIFIAYTNLPRYEGNIPNGELFVMMFVLLGLLIFRKTSLYQAFLRPQEHGSTTLSLKATQSRQNFFLLFLTGTLMGLATLTKVPAIFDLGLIVVVAWIVFAQQFLGQWKGIIPFWKKLSAEREIAWGIWLQLLTVISGWAVMIALSIFYYAVRGTLDQYIDYGLLYNFRYAGNWVPHFDSALTSWAFTLKGKVILLVSWVLAITFFKKNVSRAFLMGSSWLALTLVAATLSNRPYPHYFLQVFPGLAIVCAVIISVAWETLQLWQKNVHRRTDLKVAGRLTQPVVEVAGCIIIIAALFSTLSILHVTPYPTQKYYQLFFKLATKQISWETYRDQFNPVLKDNYQVARLLMKSPEQEIFIWGTNPLLYALSGKHPVGRFTVSFHIDDFHAYRETLDAIQAKHPTFIIVMKNQAPLPGLNELLEASYMPNSEYSTLTVWRRSVR